MFHEFEHGERKYFDESIEESFDYRAEGELKNDLFVSQTKSFKWGDFKPLTTPT